jgi:aryl-alcohol dehydrogenase-like predicted oxidoreductase
MQKRKLGNQGLMVSKMGLGCKPGLILAALHRYV